MQPQTQHTELQGWQRLVGTWATEATHPALPGIVVSGQATFEWLEDQRLLIQRSHYDHPEIPDAIAVTGIIDGKPSMHYFGPRGGHRVFAVDFTADTRRCWNDAPGFSLRTADPTIAFTCRSPDTTPRISTHMPDSRGAAVPYAATTWKLRIRRKLRTHIACFISAGRRVSTLTAAEALDGRAAARRAVFNGTTRLLRARARHREREEAGDTRGASRKP